MKKNKIKLQERKDSETLVIGSPIWRRDADTTAEMRRGFCVLAFCGASNKRDIKK